MAQEQASMMSQEFTDMGQKPGAAIRVPGS
jgi:hypothetical protein